MALKFARFPPHWRSITPLSVVLWPLSALYGAAAATRRALYRARVLRSERLPVPVVVIGNLMAGGTGKTPLTLVLARHLGAAGYRPGIVCSGYGGRRRQPGEVTARSDPLETGDEAVLLASLAACPVWSGRDRVAAARGLLAAHSGCDVIVCDDGLQHYRLERSVEVEVVDERGHGNGLLLPAGPLREPSRRRLDAHVINGGRAAPGRTGTGRARIPAFAMALEPAFLYRLDRPHEAVEAAALKGLRLHAVAGIGNPQRFFDTLTGMGLSAEPHAFADHHAFRPDEIAFADCDAILMTEKDAVKCGGFGRDDLYALRVEASVEPDFFELVRSRLPPPASKQTTTG